MKFPMYGGCQCGKIRFAADSLLDNPHVCHCRMCQKAVGNFFAALVGVPLNHFSWTRGTPAAFTSSEFVTRGFCADCGTPIFFRHAKNKHISISIGAFDQPEKIPLAFQLGMEKRLPQIDQLADLKDYGTTDESDPEGVAGIKASNRQHPDHGTTDWQGENDLPSEASGDDSLLLKETIEEMYQNICRAFTKLDIESVLDYFADSEEMVKISNGNVLRGKTQLTDYWKQQLGSTDDLQITIDGVEIHKINDKHIWATANETISQGGQTQKAVVSNIFTLTAYGWKILLDHTTYLQQSVT